MKFLFLLIAASLVKAQSAYDVCVIGGGAGGASAAAYAKDKGLSVVIIEKEGRLGGHCHTVPLEAPASSPDWFDIGTIVFPDTSKINDLLGLSGQRKWPIDYAAFVRRYAGEDSIIPFSRRASQTYFVNDGDETAFVAPPPGPGFSDALARFSNIIKSYRWLDRSYPDGPFPPEILAPFSEFIAANNLEALIPTPIFTTFMNGGGMGSFDKLTTLYALRQITESDLLLVSQYAGSTWFYVKNGCASVYHGIASYIGNENIIYNAEVTKVKRRNNKIKIQVKNSEKSTINLKCGKLVMAFPQVVDKMSFMDLDDEEKDVFSTVKTRNYMTGLVDLVGPISTNSSYTLRHINSSNLYNQTSYPSWVGITKSYTYGPAALYSLSEDHVSADQMKSILDQQLSNLPDSIATGHNITLISPHAYYPYPSNDVLSVNDHFFKRADRLQGHRNTFWVGALFSMNAHHAIVSHSYDITKAHF